MSPRQIRLGRWEGTGTSGTGRLPRHVPATLQRTDSVYWRVLPAAIVVAMVMLAPRPQATDGISRPVVTAAGLIYVSAISSPSDSTAPLSDGPAELDRQTRAVLDELRQDLSTASSSLDDVVDVSVYLRRPADFDAMNAVYKAYFPQHPPARTTVAADLAPGTLIEVSAIAVPTGTPRQTLQPTTWAKASRPYSYMVRAGDLVFLSGLVSRRGSDDAVVPGSASLQTRTILDNAGTLLRTAGLTYSNVVAARVFVADDTDFEAMNTEYRRRFATEPPARATAVTGLMGNDALVEIALIASTLPKEIIGPAVTPTLPVSTGVRAGSHVFLSGVTGTSDTNAEDPTGQTSEALGHLAHALALVGLSASDVVDTTVFVPQLSNSQAIDAVYGAFFGPQPPARTVVGTRLVSHTGLVEIMATAVSHSTH